MKKIATKILLVSVLSSSFIVSSGCRPKKGDIGLNCQRLSSCFATYSAVVTDTALKNNINSAINMGDEGQCTTLAQTLSKLPDIEKQGGCPF